jgi:RNA polymerase sigma-70 factor, ECF subfamily
MTVQPEAEERGLIERAARGDRLAFTSLVEANRGAVYRFALRLTRDQALAEDVLQDTFLAAMKGLAGWRGDGSFRGWLYAVARSRVLMARRKKVGEPEAFESNESLEVLGLQAGWGAPMDAEALAARVQQQSVLEAALSGLEPEDREVLVLRDLEGLSGEETAQALGLSLPAMKSRLHRARLRLVAAVKGGNRGD